MSMDLTGIVNKNEYFTNHYFSTVFEENASATISGWNVLARIFGGGLNLAVRYSIINSD